MSETPRETVVKCLKFANPARIPRDVWLLPWAETRYPETVAELERIFPSDFVLAPDIYLESSKNRSGRYKRGSYTDEWGCVFDNIQDGIIGEVVHPIIKDISGWDSVKPPYHDLPGDAEKSYDEIRRFYETSDKFVFANCWPRPWERYQFLRGFQSALMDVMMFEYGGKKLLKKIHEYYLAEIEFWCKSDVDAVKIMDDWGSQKQLLIRPEMWREYFKPLYMEYCQLAKSYGKFIFMHSDGYIVDILPDLIEIGIDAVNSQLFCMDIEDLGRKFKGKITFWGEIDRQHILPSADPNDGRKAVRRVFDSLCGASGGVIAEFEFGPGANPQTILAIAREWNAINDKILSK
jgi:uroporphyrinogen decarboxylase